MNEPYNPSGYDYIDLVDRREKKLVTDGPFTGWIAWKHPDGQWVSERKITELERALVSALDAAEKRAEEAEAENERLQTPTYYWDDRDLDSAVPPDEVGEFDDAGDVIPLRPIHELPTRWARVTESGVLWFDSEEAAKGAKP